MNGRLRRKSTRKSRIIFLVKLFSLKLNYLRQLTGFYRLTVRFIPHSVCSRLTALRWATRAVSMRWYYCGHQPCWTLKLKQRLAEMLHDVSKVPALMASQTLFITVGRILLFLQWQSFIQPVRPLVCAHCTAGLFKNTPFVVKSRGDPP